MNDLWKFDGINWVWISGTDIVDHQGNHVTQGIPHPNNVPGGRLHAVSWIDSLNNLYLFGGGSSYGTFFINY